MKRLDARTYLKETFRSVTDAAHSVWFDAGTPANRVAEYLEEYAARTHGVMLIDAQEMAEHLLQKLADARVLQEEWFRYACNGGDPLRLRENVIEPFGYAEILDHRGKIYGVRFPNSCLVATAYDEPDLYEGEDARTMWKKYARHVSWLQHVCRGHIIWHTAHEDAQDHEIFPLCAECTQENELVWGTIFDVESGHDYEHSIRCEHCDVELAHCVLPETVFLQGDNAVEALSGNCGLCNEPLTEHYELDARGDLQMYADKDLRGDLVGFLCPSCAIDVGFKYAELHGEWNPKRKEID
jgi:hypothetical protein